MRSFLFHCIYKKDFYILDEPNAALDAVSEKEILDYMESIIKDKIAVIITHRMENIPYLNKRILVIKHGEIVASGFRFDYRFDFQKKYKNQINNCSN